MMLKTLPRSTAQRADGDGVEGKDEDVAGASICDYERLPGQQQQQQQHQQQQQQRLKLSLAKDKREGGRGSHNGQLFIQFNFDVDSQEICTLNALPSLHR